VTANESCGDAEAPDDDNDDDDDYNNECAAQVNLFRGPHFI
jgi:hypothetical protein